MKDGFKVIDADRHVLEPSDLFEKYLPEKFRGRVEIKGPNQTHRLVDGEKISDADKLRDTSKQEDVGLPSAAPNAGAKLSPKRWLRDSTPGPMSATWTERVSTPACSFPPWACT
jgi:hypothetical protein